ncbi:MAG: leucine--tRNA ligase [Chloroflexaceae bacterium]|nr:leucine--tRNA ligase [Chloroflexaceae bacterium]
MSQMNMERKTRERYDPSRIEKKWQDRWAADELYRTASADERPKYYVLDFYPYPSGEGLSVGHCRNYVPTDVLARYYRMKGYQVLHPMGWDAFGLPAENAAIKQKTNPARLIRQYANNYKRQMHLIGASYDWSREINSSTPEYYHWTQWIFLQLYHSWYDARVDAARPIRALEEELALHGTLKLALPLSEPRMTADEWKQLPPLQQQEVLGRFRLAYRSEAAVNWDPVDKTVIANEEVDAEGRAWRSGALVERKVLKQWFFRITAYAERLSRDLDLVDWPPSIVAMQRNWIGGSAGAEVIFRVAPHPDDEKGEARADGGSAAFEVEESAIETVQDEIIVFTTRPDTLWGTTFMVLAPEHPLVTEVTTTGRRAAVKAYVTEARAKPAAARVGEDREKTGVFTGGYAINPVNGARIPIWIADYVLMEYGTGAIMAVPAHDERDFAFALKYHLPIIPVIARPDDLARSRVLHGTYREGLVEALRAAGYAFEEHDGTLDVTLTGVQALNYATLVKKYLTNRWTEVVGSGWLAVFPDEIIIFDSIEVDRRIMVRMRSDSAEGEEAALPATFMGYLAAVPFYREVIYHHEYGPPINSGPMTGIPGEKAIEKTIEWLEEQEIGLRRQNYKMRDWLISRQRYWGTPIPIIHTEDGLEVAVSEEELPVRLPDVESYEPTATGESPLALVDSWVQVTLPDSRAGKRETDTMGTFACSSWYFLRFADPHNRRDLAAPEALRYWLPVDMYVGGAEHAVMHLLYARFWTKLLYDLGVVGFVEPFTRLRNQGLILAADGRKMSKSFHNVITPDEVVAELGADALRGYECFISDFELAVPWSTQGVPGVRRWLDRVWRIVLSPEENPGQPAEMGERDLLRITHQSIQRVEHDILDFKFNTMVAALMGFTNALYRARDAGLVATPAWDEAITTLLLLMAPVAPHIAEEIWEGLGRPYSIHQQAWPVANPALAAEEVIEVVLQVNGKVRDKVEVAVNTDETTLRELALANERIRGFMEGKEARKVVVVPNKLVNIVI